MKFKSPLAAALLALTATGSAFAGVYPDPGHENTVSYTFEATGGEIKAYFLSSDAAYTSFLGMDGLAHSSLSNHGQPVGHEVDLGAVAAGQLVTFYLSVASPSLTWSSDAALNSDGANHLYSTSYTGGAIPAGTLLAFEDLPNSASDHDYNDAVFVVTGVTAVPEPANLALMLAGLGLMGLMVRRRRGH